MNIIYYRLKSFFLSLFLGFLNGLKICRRGIVTTRRNSPTLGLLIITQISDLHQNKTLSVCLFLQLLKLC